MESVWQHGGSIRVKISKLIPWDIHVTAFGWMLLIFPTNLILAGYRLIEDTSSKYWLIYLMVFLFMSGIMALAVFTDKRPIWVHFMGTRLHFTDPDKTMQAHMTVQENGWRWNKDVLDITIIDSKKMSMIFRRRDHALLTKLAA